MSYREQVCSVSPVDYPWAGKPRRFVAAAMPQGDPQFGVTEPLVMLVEHRGGGLPRTRLLSLAEAAQLRAEIDSALRVPAHAAALLAEAEIGPARAAQGPFPFRHHRSLEETSGKEE